MGWTFLYLMLFLKLPILALLGIVWWAIRQQPNPYEESSGDDGGIKRAPHPRRPFPRRPTPRRGPHGAPSPPPPPRVRSAIARTRALER
jgi:hypothetical protein